MQARGRPASHGWPVAAQIAAGVAFSMVTHSALVAAGVAVAHRASMVTLEQACAGFAAVVAIDLALATGFGRTGPFAMRLAMLLTIAAAGFGTFVLLACGALMGP